MLADDHFSLSNKETKIPHIHLIFGRSTDIYAFFMIPKFNKNYRI